jgi:hypothetical protein
MILLKDDRNHVGCRLIPISGRSFLLHLKGWESPSSETVALFDKLKSKAQGADNHTQGALVMLSQFFAWKDALVMVKRIP